MEIFRGTRAEINLDNLKYNIGIVRKEIGPDVEPMAVIKADAYGHGAVVMMKYMMKYGIRYFGVSTINEALELRRAHKEAYILVLGISSDRLLHYGVDNDICQCITNSRQAELLSEYCVASGKTAAIWIKVNTGLHRLGFPANEESIAAVVRICRLPGLRVDGIFSHLALEGEDFDHLQWERFKSFIAACEAQGCVFPIKSLVDGIGTGRYHHMHFNMVRPGAFFYGFNPDRNDLKPVMCLKSEIVHLNLIPAGDGVGYGLDDAADHDRIIATLPFGYVDGVPRALSHYRGWCVVKGVKCPIVGLLCMDQGMIDVSDVPDVQDGDEVTVYDSDGIAMSYPEAAKLADFNRNGLESAVARRVPKVYFENGEIVEVRDYLLDD